MDRNSIVNLLKEIFITCSVMDESEEDITVVESTAAELDSFTYISVLLEIEERFEIEIPEKYLGENILVSLDFLCNLIEDLKNNTN